MTVVLGPGPDPIIVAQKAIGRNTSYQLLLRGVDILVPTLTNDNLQLAGKHSTLNGNAVLHTLP